ncbi:MAG: tetratricopeptide repeat protein [bacterium]|nr:tetratricopeptide repeat protein [bacterium]
MFNDPTSPISALSGKTFGQYELRELLGEGGMGAVYRGFQRSLNREVAVKVMTPQVARDPEYLARFTREAHTAAALEHPHIITIHDYGTHQLPNGVEVPFVVMRLLSGGTLTERLTRQNVAGTVLPSLGETAELLRQMASALDYAHSKGVIHRDIKPSNIMFDSHGSAFLVDFGIVKLADTTTLTEAGTAMGTPAYMPPEQWRGTKLTPAADQYALAVVVYRLVTGKMPFDGETTYNLMYQHLNEQPTPPHGFRPDLPEAISQVLEKALAKEPDERYPSVTAFAEGFEAAIRSQRGEQTGLFTYQPPAKVPPMPTPISRDASRAASQAAPPLPDVDTVPPVRSSPAPVSAPTHAQTITGGRTVEPSTATKIPFYRQPISWIGGLVLLIGIVAIVALSLEDDSSGLSSSAPLSIQTSIPGELLEETATEEADSTAIVAASTSEATEATAEATQSVSSTPRPTAVFVAATAADVSDLLENAQAAASAGDYAQAVALYDAVLTSDPDNPDALLGRGSAYADQGLGEEALADVERLLELDPDNDLAYLLRAEVLLYAVEIEDHLQRAVADFTRAIELDPQHPRPYNGRGAAYALLGEYTLAVGDFDRLLELNPDFPEGHYRRGLAYLSLGDYADAVNDFDQAIALLPEYGDAYAARGDAHHALGNFEDALDDYGEFVRLGGELDPVQQERIEVMEMALTATAQPAPTGTRRPSSTPRATATHVATATRAATATQVAASSARITPTADSEAAQTALDRGSALLADGDCAAAMEEFTEAVRLDPNQLYAWISRAYCRSILGEDQPAAEDALRFVELQEQEVIEGDALETDEIVTLEMVYGRVYRLPLELREGETITLSAVPEPDGVDTLIVLLAPDGTPLIHNDDYDLSNTVLESRIVNFPVPESGTYTLIVTHAGGNNTGAVGVVLERGND